MRLCVEGAVECPEQGVRHGLGCTSDDAICCGAATVIPTPPPCAELDEKRCAVDLRCTPRYDCPDNCSDFLGCLDRELP